WHLLSCFITTFIVVFARLLLILVFFSTCLVLLKVILQIIIQFEYLNGITAMFLPASKEEGILIKKSHSFFILVATGITGYASYKGTWIQRY
ncbi:hypothetical protein ACJX0J_018005, partial [Zea mays]